MGNKRQHEGAKYLAHFPKLQKQINRCAACGRQGYRPDMPEQIHQHFSFASDILKKHFTVLEVNSVGLCEQCALALERSRDRS
jgi:hypothetical protein